MIGELATHVWQSTLFAFVAGLLTAAFRKNRAKVRYWLWFSASLKFLIPFSLLISLGSQLGQTPVARNHATPAVSFAMARITQPFPGPLSFAPARPVATNWPPIAFLGVWVSGFVAITLIRLRAWLRIRAVLHTSTALEIPALEATKVEVRSSAGLLEPGVFGLFRPILLLPEGFVERLTPSQVEAVLAHELCHVRRHDNLFASIHMLVEAMFWFHPLVWWIGARLVEERERACDEGVLVLGSEPRIYAEAILSVCKLYVESPLVCVSGVAGANLRRRIEAIMTNRCGQRLNRGKKFLLASAGVAALAVPVLIGIGNAPAIRAQSPAAAPPVAPTAQAAPAVPGNAGTPQPAASPARDLTVERIQEVVKQAVTTISICREGDPRAAAALATLRELPESTAVPMVAAYLTDDRNTIRRAAIYILSAGPFRSIDAAIGQLKQLCKHSEDFTRGMAALALGTRRVASSQPILIEMATADASPYARRAAAYALGLLGDPAALPALERVARDPDTTVAANARASIEMLRSTARP